MVDRDIHMSTFMHAPSSGLAPIRNRGVSLIELMVAMAIGLVLVATISSAYIGAKTSFRSQNALSNIQENARYAHEFMGVDIRMAGYSGGPMDVAITQPSGWTGVQDLQNYPLVGYEDGVSTFPTFPVSRPRLAGTDALTVVHVDNENEYALDTTVTPNPSTTTFTLASWPGTAPAVGGIFVGSDYTHTAAFTVSAVSSGTKTVTTADGLGVFGGAVGARRLYPLKGATYYIANNLAGEPSLFRLKLAAGGGTTPEELVEGVGNMQIAYGVATDALPDTNVNAYWTADQVDAGTDGTLTMPVETPTDPPSGYWKRVLSVRVTLTLTTKQNERITTAGGLYTKTFTTTFAVRNRL